jgi:hypothetical protein
MQHHMNGEIGILVLSVLSKYSVMSVGILELLLNYTISLIPASIVASQSSG